MSISYFLIIAFRLWANFFGATPTGVLFFAPFGRPCGLPIFCGNTDAAQDGLDHRDPHRGSPSRTLMIR
jgi:hypothetical protein